MAAGPRKLRQLIAHLHGYVGPWVLPVVAGPRNRSRPLGLAPSKYARFRLSFVYSIVWSAWHANTPACRAP